MDGAFCFQSNTYGVGYGFLPELEYENTPEHVAEVLKQAYPREAAWPEHSFPATAEEEAEAAAAGSSLFYAELHRDGLTRLFGPSGLDLEGLGARSFADLGSGRGHVALQAFLQLPQLERVLGLELVGARHGAAVAAARRLAEAHPTRFALDAPPGGAEGGLPSSATLVEGTRRCEFRRGDFWQLSRDEFSGFGALLLNVPLPDRGPAESAAALKLCSTLAERCAQGCLLATSSDLHELWRSLPPGGPRCCFRKLALPEGSFANIASTVGTRTYAFLCDRERQQCVESFQSTPEEVERALELAYEGREMWQEDVLEATADETEHAAAVGTSLTYGEVRPGGFTKLLGPSGLDLEGRGAVRLLELGSGRGRLALQAFLQYPSLRQVVGVELVQSRHDAALAAMQRLADAFPGRWRLELSAQGAALSEGDDGAAARRCELRQGDFSELPGELLREADVVLLEVVLAKGPDVQATHAQLLGRLARGCRQGCALAAYEDLQSLWQALPADTPPCPFRRLQLCGTGFCTSWCSSGHNFHGFVCDRENPVHIQRG